MNNTTSQKETPDVVDPISRIIGDVGRYQILRIGLVFLISLPGICHIFCLVFGMAQTDFWCTEPGFTNDTINDCFDDQCTSFGFDQSFWSNTIIMEYSLVCSRKKFGVAAKFALFGGFGIGTFGAGLVSDLFGRRTGIILFSQLLFGAGIIATVMPDILSFSIAWFFVGVAAIGVYTVCIVWSMEMVAGKWKTFFGMCFGFSWGFSRLLAALAAYVTRDWKSFFQIFAGLHLVTPLVMIIIPESPKWLISKDRMDESLMVLNNINKNNNRPEVSKETFHSIIKEMKVTEAKKEHFWNMFLSSTLWRRTLIMYWNWFTASFIVYGLDLNWQTLSKNLFGNFVIGSALHILSKILALIIVFKGGMKKLPIVFFMFVAGISFVISLAFERDVYEYDWPIVACALTGSAAISICFAILWVYSAELYPTSVRNASVGSCSFVSRLGGISANFVPHLAEFGLWIPVLMFSLAAFTASFLTLFLEETTGEPLPNTIDDVKGQRVSIRHLPASTFKVRRHSKRSERL